MATIALYNFPDQYRNDTFNGVQFTIQDADTSTGIDLTNATIKTEFKKGSKTGAIVKTLTIGSGITVTDAVNGVLQFDAFILDWDVATYHYDLEVTFNSGVVKSYIFGTLKVIQDVTNG